MSMTPAQLNPLQTAQSDLSSLNRVSHRVAMVDSSERLQQVLDKLLPRLLKRVGDNHAVKQQTDPTETSLVSVYQQIHDQLVATLSHIMKRVRHDTNCRLPCAAILNLFLTIDQQQQQPDKDEESKNNTSSTKELPQRNQSLDPVTTHLALAFLTLGITRQSKGDLYTMTPSLMACQMLKLETTALRTQSHQFAHLLLVTLENLATHSQSHAKDEHMVLGSDSAPLWQTQQILVENTTVAETVFDLFLDILLYQPTTTVQSNNSNASTTLPPPGLSQAGNDRLRPGTDWAVDVASRTRLAQLKEAILTMVAPSRRWTLFLPDLSSSDIQNTLRRDNAYQLGVARTVALMVAAMGDHDTPQVHSMAQSLLKIHHDSSRFTSKHPSNSTTSSNEETKQASTPLLGNAIALVNCLLSLCLGQTHAEAILSENPSAQQLGGNFRHSNTGDSTTTLSNQIVLSTKRRPVSDSCAATILTFVATNVFDDNALAFTGQDAIHHVLHIGKLTYQIAQQRLVATPIGVSGLSSLRAKPYISAAHLLNAVSVRMATYFDETMNDTIASQSKHNSFVETISQIFAAACQVLTPVATQPPSSSSQRFAGVNDGNLAIRDYCYGVICTFARCRYATLEAGYVFSRGKVAEIGGRVATAKLLFDCAANEDERLRPRAVAALDTLLASYLRRYSHPGLALQTSKAEKHSPLASPVVAAVSNANNPWASASLNEKAPSSPTHCADENALLKALLPLLWSAAQAHKSKASRTTVARWATELLRVLDLVKACHLLCFLAGDGDSVVASIAREGLGFRDKNRAYTSEYLESTLETLPDFAGFVALVFDDEGTRTKGTGSLPARFQKYPDFYDNAKAMALRLGLVCLLDDYYGSMGSAVETYLAFLQDSLRQFVGGLDRSTTLPGSALDLLEECSLCLRSLLSASSLARTTCLAGESSFSLEEMKRLALDSQSSLCRRYLAESIGILLQSKEVNKTTAALFVEETLEECCSILKRLQSSDASAATLHGAAFLGAHALRAFRCASENKAFAPSKRCVDHAASLARLLGKGILVSEELVGNACVDSISIAFSYTGPDAPALQVQLVEPCTELLTFMIKANQKFSHVDTLNVSRVLKCAVACGRVLASTTRIGDPNDDRQLVTTHEAIRNNRLDCVDSLFGLLGSAANRKEDEVAISAGDALSHFADAFCPSDRTWPPLSSWPEQYDNSFARSLPPHELVLFVLLRHVMASSSPQKRTAVAPALLAFAARAARGVVRDPSFARRAIVRTATWKLEEIQSAFVTLLADPKTKHFGRESCCLGLAACRGLLQSGASSTDSTVERMNNRLLRAFGHTTVYAGSVMQETAAQAAERRAHAGMLVETEETDQVEGYNDENNIGGASGIGEAALGAYREMASASVSLGRPDILFGLLVLSVSHPFWFVGDARHMYSGRSILGKTFGDASNATEMKNALRPHLSKLLPHLLRARHDPNPQTKEQMASLWSGLTGGGPEARSLVSLHLLPTIDALITDSSSRLWRVRAGACGALAEIIVGREWDALGGGGAVLTDDFMYTKVTDGAGVRLLRLWRASMRVLDDVRGSVRDVGGTLARAVRGLTIRLSDPNITEGDRQTTGSKRTHKEMMLQTSAAAATSLRWLVQHGLNQHSDGAAICTTTLVEVVGLVTPVILEPILPDIIKSLLLAISRLEPSVLNYLQLRTNDQDSLERVRLQAAQSGPIASAVSKCLSLAPGTSQRTQNQIVIALGAALRQSPGFASRAAIADTVSSLCHSCPQAFRFEGTGNSNPSVRLLRALYAASEYERTTASRDRLVHSLGHLAAVCPGRSVTNLAIKLCEKYKKSTGSYHDDVSRLASTSALRSLAIRASNHVGGEFITQWRQRVLPVSFVGRHDENEKVARLWQEIWEEAGTAVRVSSMSHFGPTLEENLLEEICMECVSALGDVSWAPRVAGCRALAALTDLGVLSPLSGANATPTKADPHLNARLVRRAWMCQVSLQCCIELLKKPRLWEGKAEVAKTSGKLAGAWVSSTAELAQQDENTHFSNPVDLWASSANNLLDGDNWFHHMSEEMEGAESVMQLEEDALREEEETVENKCGIDDDVDDDNEEEDARVLDNDSNPLEVGRQISYKGLCRFFLQQAFCQQRDIEDLLLPYRIACLNSLYHLLDQIPVIEHPLSTEFYQMIISGILKLVETPGEPPVLLAAAIDCLGSAFFGEGETATAANRYMEVLFNLGGSKQPAWTVREASANCVAKLAMHMNPLCFREHHLLSKMLDIVAYDLKDRKYWRVRYAGMKILQGLVQRTGVDRKDQRRDGILEGVLPFKESIQKQLRLCLKDSNAQITALGSELISKMSWWP